MRQTLERLVLLKFYYININMLNTNWSVGNTIPLPYTLQLVSDSKYFSGTKFPEGFIFFIELVFYRVFTLHFFLFLAYNSAWQEEKCLQTNALICTSSLVTAASINKNTTSISACQASLYNYLLLYNKILAFCINVLMHFDN